MTRLHTHRPPELADTLTGPGLLAGAANVIMQLAWPEVGYGVVESRVHSGNLFRHPVKRTRTTLSYLAVAIRGTEAEREAYRRGVNTSHAQVRSGPSSPVGYNAFDPELQLWVAACLYRGLEDVQRLFGERLEPEDAERLYRESAVLGSTLQVPAERWPADRAAFERYWAAGLGRVSIDDTVREHLTDVMLLRWLPRVISVPLEPFNRFVTAGFLPPEFREQMLLTWSPARQRRFERFTGLLGAVVRRLPRWAQAFPYNVLLWDLRRRIRAGRPLV
jgi:uncharacterized protein (DUF2236 family)